jgi:hypothetical protein
MLVVIGDDEALVVTDIRVSSSSAEALDDTTNEVVLYEGPLEIEIDGLVIKLGELLLMVSKIIGGEVLRKQTSMETITLHWLGS